MEPGDDAAMDAAMWVSHHPDYPRSRERIVDWLADNYQRVDLMSDTKRLLRSLGRHPANGMLNETVGILLDAVERGRGSRNG